VNLRRPLIVVGIALGILIALGPLATYLSGVPTDVYSSTN
jgi:hypothetical protein